MDNEWFTMKVYHGGELEVIKGVSSKYLGGEIDHFDYCSSHYISMFELLDFASRLGYNGRVNLFYKPNRGGRFEGFEPLQTQTDVVELRKMLNEDRLLVVYMVVPAKPIKLDFTLCAEKPIELSSDDETVVDDDARDDECNCSDHDETKHDENHSNVDTDNTDGRNNHPLGSNHTEGNERNDSSSATEENEDIPDKRGKTAHSKYRPTTSSSNGEGEESNTTDSELSNESWSTELEDTSAESDLMSQRFSVKEKHSHSEPGNHDFPNVFRVGKVYANPDEFRNAVREYSIVSRRGIVFKKNERRRVRAVCRPSCPWTCFASSIGNDRSDTSLVVKTFNGVHTCSKVFQKKWVTDNWLADKYASKWNANSKWKRSSFDKEVRTTTGGKVSTSKFYRTRRKAVAKVHGTTVEQYSRLWEYRGALKESNPGSTVEMMVADNGEQNEFKRLYVCFDACKKGWVSGCRRIIGLDGCKIKVPIGMKLLTAVGIDADNDIYPIAFAVVENESIETWSWFLSYLAPDLELGNNCRVTWISDKENGLEDIIKRDFPRSEHRLCVLHLYNLFKRAHSQRQLKTCLWKAAKARTTLRYEIPN